MNAAQSQKATVLMLTAVFVGGCAFLGSTKHTPVPVVNLPPPPTIPVTPSIPLATTPSSASPPKEGGLVNNSAENADYMRRRAALEAKMRATDAELAALSQANQRGDDGGQSCYRFLWKQFCHPSIKPNTDHLGNNFVGNADYFSGSADYALRRTALEAEKHELEAEQRKLEAEQRAETERLNEKIDRVHRRNKCNSNSFGCIPSPGRTSETIDAKLEGALNDAGFQQRVEQFIDSLKNAAYTFNPPSPIDVDKPHRVYLLLDPQENITNLIEKLETLAPADAAGIQSGETKWAPVMEASLSAAKSDFKIDACALEKKTLSGTEQAQWCWEITPQHPGTKMPLNLSLRAILPGEFAPAHEVTLLHRDIDVSVTLWWLFDHYFDKYWKWLLGGLGGFVVGVIAREWRRRKTGKPKRSSKAPKRPRAATARDTEMQ